MTNKELSRITERDVIYDESAGIAYNVIKSFKSGILTYWEWTNPYGRFTEDKFLKNEELLCKDIILIRGDTE